MSDGRITIQYKDGMTKSVPVESVEGISVFGAANISTRCMQECLLRGMDVEFYSSGGSYFGRLSSTQHVNVARQRLQVRRSEDEAFCLALSKRIIKAKIHNQTVVLRRYARSVDVNVVNEVSAMLKMEKKIEHCTAIDELMGFEGNAAKSYYYGLGRLVVPEFAFKGRSRRPPRDAFNSMLSLGYAILMHTMYGALESRGFNPYFGFLHADREKHPALASDLMEEWRAVIVDSVVMAMVNGREILPEHFYTVPGEPGVFLNKDGFKLFISKLEKRFAANQKYLSYADYPVPFRRAIFMQAGELAKAVEAGDAGFYSPIVIR